MPRTDLASPQRLCQQLCIPIFPKRKCPEAPSPCHDTHPHGLSNTTQYAPWELSHLAATSPSASPQLDLDSPVYPPLHLPLHPLRIQPSHRIEQLTYCRLPDMAKQPMSMEAMLDEERREVLALLEGQKAKRQKPPSLLEGRSSSPIASPRSPVRSILDIGQDVPFVSQTFPCAPNTNPFVANSPSPAAVDQEHARYWRQRAVSRGEKGPQQPVVADRVSCSPQHPDRTPAEHVGCLVQAC